MIFYTAGQKRKPQSIFRSQWTLLFQDPCASAYYKKYFEVTMITMHTRLAIITMSVLCLALIFALISGAILRNNDGYPYLMLYIILPIMLGLTIIWFVVPLKFTSFRPYVGMVPIFYWTVFCAEYMCYERENWVLPPGSLILFISCFIYGVLLCNSWIKSSASFCAGMVYFTIRTGLKLKLVSISMIELCLSMGVLVLFSSWFFYFTDYKSRMDFIDLYDKIEITKFGKYFMEQIPIGTIITTVDQVLFANQEMKSILNMNDIQYPLYNADSEASKRISTILYNFKSHETDDTLSGMLLKNNFQVEGMFVNSQSYYKIISKTTDYANKPCQIYCLFDITKQRQLEKDRLAKHLQTVFMATMSHELRTPIIGINGAIKELKEKMANTEHSTLLSTIDTCTTILLFKVNDMLDYAQNETTSIKLYPKQINLRVLFNEVYSNLREMAFSKKIKFNLYLSDDLPSSIIIDENRLNQILYNVIGNSIQYTFKGKVDIKCSCSDSYVEIEVDDTGIGIKLENQKHIGQLFVEKLNKSSGMGLGLHISYILAKAMKGKILFTSQEGEGSKFQLTIPFARDRNECSELKKAYLSTEICCPKVLIVDDNNFNLAVLEGMLKKFNISCGKAMNGKEAIDCIIESQKRKCCSPYELVLMDCNMPILDGYQATEQIIISIKNHEIKSLNIVGVTAFTSSEHLDNCISCGMDMACMIVTSVQAGEDR